MNPEPPLLPDLNPATSSSGRRGLSLFGKIAIGLVVVICAALAVRVVQSVIYFKDHPRSPAPGETAFLDANKLITANRGQRAFGNTPKATELADHYSKALKDLRAEFFTEGKGEEEFLSLLTKGDFLTYCHVSPQSCVFLVQVPELRHFTRDAKKKLGLLAWENAQSVIGARSDLSITRVAVGVRGVINYDQIMTGRYVPKSADMGEGIEKRESGLLNVSYLYPYFTEAPQRESR